MVRVQSAGPLVKIELRDTAGQAIFVEMSHDRFRREPHTVGDEVLVTPRDSRLFVDDYSL